MSPAGENVGQAWIGVAADDQTKGTLKKIEAEVERSMRKIGAMEATAEIDANIRGFQKDALYVKEEMARLDKMKATPEVKADKSALKELNGEINRSVTALRLRKAELKANADAEERAAKRIDVTTKAEERKTKALSHAEAATRKMIGTQSRAIDMDKRRTIEVEKLRQSYAKMLGQQSKMERRALFGNAFDKSRLAQFNAELDHTGHRIKELGGDFDDLDAETERSSGRLKKMASSLGSVRVQMGPLSGTLRQVATGFTVLGPVVFALAGQIASLIGVAGTGLAGAMSVGAAGLSGFVLSMGGIIAIAKPLVGELTDARKASEAYGDAVRKYGKGSTEAATAQEKLNKTLKDVSPEARHAFQSIGTMGDRWNKLTQDAGRRSFFDLIGSGVRAANSLMPMFARQSVKTFDVAAAAAQKWTEAFTSGGARQGISDIMTGFREALPAINSGFLSLGTAIGRISVSASKLMPSLMGGFSDWAKNISDATAGGGLDATISRLVDHMRQIGQFAQSAGSMLATFFNAGANQGASLLSTLTNIFDRWNAWMSSASGQNSLASFFQQSNQLGSAFISSIGQMGVALFEFSSALAPLSQGFVAAVHAASSLTAAVMGLSGARTVLAGIGGALAGAFVGGKIMAAIALIGQLRTAMASLAAAGSLSTLFAGGPLVAGLAVLGGAVAVFASISAGANTAGGAIDAMRASLDATRASLDAFASADAESASAHVATASAIAARTSAEKNLKAAEDAHGKNSQQAKDAAAALASASQSVTDARQREAAATTDLDQKQKAAASSAKKGITDSRTALAAANNDLESAQRGMAEKWGSAWKNLATNDPKRALEDIAGLFGSSSDEAERLKEAQQGVAEATRDINKYQEQAGRANLNMLRSTKDQAGISAKIGNEWRNIRTSLKPQAKSLIASAANPDDVARVVKLSSSLKDMGKMGAANRILMNTKDVDTAIQKLQKLRASTQQAQNVNVNAKANTRQAEQQIKGVGKGKSVSIATKANTRGAEQSLSKLSGKRLAALLTIRANDNDAVGKLNKIERKRLAAKLVGIGANPAAALKAVGLVEAKKISPKIAKIAADGGKAIAEALGVDRKVQGIKDKTARVNVTANTSGASQAIAAIAAVPSSKTSTIYINTVRSNAGGGSPNQDPLNKSGNRVIDNAYKSSREQKNRPGKYTRPTLLVGEERKDEYVIATNPAYRSANTGYLSMAANDLGYDLVEAAAGGKKPKKELKPKGNQAAKKNPKYAQYRDRVTFYENEAGYRETDRTQDLAAGRDPSWTPGNILGSYMKEKTAMNTLRKWMVSHIAALEKRAGLGKTKKGKNIFGSSDEERKANREVFDLEKDLKKHKKDKPKVHKDKDGNETKKSRKRGRKWEKDLNELQDKLAKQKRIAADSRSKTASYNSEIGQYQRELENTLPGEFNNLQASIDRWKDIKGGDIDDPTLPPDSGSGGGTDTPIGIQLGTLDTARYDLFKEFGSNIGGAFGKASNAGFATGGASAPAAAPNAGFAVSGPTPAAGFGRASFAPAGGSATGAAGGSGRSGTQVTQNITMMEPPSDAHTFTQQMAWEAGAGY